jgi:hypothetical protein
MDTTATTKENPMQVGDKVRFINGRSSFCGLEGVIASIPGTNDWQGHPVVIVTVAEYGIVTTNAKNLKAIA